MLLELLCAAPVIHLEGADFTMTGDVHQAQNVGAVVQGRSDKASFKDFGKQDELMLPVCACAAR
jgi:hypothetical protein